MGLLGDGHLELVQVTVQPSQDDQDPSGLSSLRGRRLRLSRWVLRKHQNTVEEVMQIKERGVERSLDRSALRLNLTSELLVAAQTIDDARQSRVLLVKLLDLLPIGGDQVTVPGRLDVDRQHADAESGDDDQHVGGDRMVYEPTPPASQSASAILESTTQTLEATELPGGLDLDAHRQLLHRSFY